MAKKRLLLVGGGSGGHITPLVAILAEIDKKQNYDIRLWCDQKTLAMSRNLLHDYPDVLVERVVAGKLRRYHHLAWWQHLRWSIFWPNFIDLFRTASGLIQSFVKLVLWRPNVVFAKGGYVCLPVGIAASLLRIKIIVHDSDTMPGLTNKILAKRALRVATGFPVEHYSYPSDKTVFTGIPVRLEYRPIKLSQQLAYKKKLGFSANRPLVVVVGGGLGSRCLNSAVVAGQHEVGRLASVALAAGQLEYESVAEKITSPAIRVKPFYDDLYEYILASDLVVCRAGATTLAELAAARKLAIVVPSAKLAGGHQLKNAQALVRAKVAIVLSEELISQSPEVLSKKIVQTLQDRDSSSMQQMLDRFHKLAKLDAASAVSDLIIGEMEG